jgi:sugar phosphate isomerase/epimerase
MGGIGRRQFLSASIGTAAGLAAPPKRWLIGCYTRPWMKSDYRAALDGIAEAGYKYVGLMSHAGRNKLVVNVETTPDEAAGIGEEVRRRGLETISIWGGDFRAQESLEAGIAGLKRLIDNCAAAGSPGLLLGGTGKEQLIQPYYKAVAECCDYAASRRVGLSVKPHGGSTSSGSQCREIVERVAHRNFGVWYDPGNIFFYSGGKRDPLDDAASANGLVVGMSIKDFKPPKNVLVTPGTGLVNFHELLVRTRKGGFSGGPLIVECVDPGEGPAIAAEARKARLFLERITAAL